MPTTEHTQAWLDTVEIVVEPNLEQQTEIENLIGSKGMATFLGLMLGARQALLVQLSRFPMGTVEAAARASVIQGQIQGIDIAWQTLLERSVPARQSEEQNP